jgi:hypothetical protein
VLAVEAASAAIFNKVYGSSSDTHPGKCKKDKKVIKGEPRCVQIMSNFLYKKTYYKQLSLSLRAGNSSMVAMLQSMADFWDIVLNFEDLS